MGVGEPVNRLWNNLGTTFQGFRRRLGLTRPGRLAPDSYLTLSTIAPLHFEGVRVMSRADVLGKGLVAGYGELRQHP